MNRSLLLIVCDFLLLSLLALAEFEKTGQARTEARELVVQAEQEMETRDPLLVQLLEDALSAERENQLEVEAQLEEERRQREEERLERERLRESLEGSQLTLEEERRALEEARRLAAESAVQREETERRMQDLSSERERLATERAQLETAVQELESTVTRREEDAEMSTQEMQALRDELAANRQRLEEAEQARRETEMQARDMATRLQAADRERELLASNLESARETISLGRQDREVLRRQTETLTAGVSRLAETSTDIQDEVRGLRPMTANEIYNRVRNQVVEIQFTGQRRSLFGGNEIDTKIETILTKIEGRSYIWIHIAQTPFASAQSRSFIESLSATLRIGEARYRIPQLGILRSEPRLLFIPVPTEIMDQSDKEVFTTSPNPFRYDELVIIDPTRARFGETSFRIEPGRDHYLSVDRRAFSSLFGEFSPQLGNLAFTKNGGFLGIVVRNGEAWKAGNVSSSSVVGLGDAFNAEALNALPEP